MQYIYHKEAGGELLEVEGDIYRYLFRARRERIGSIVEFRNLIDAKLYSYKIISIDKKKASLKLIFGEKKEVLSNIDLTLGWCIVEPKTIEKTLPSLNEIGVKRIVFIKCAYSQANYKIKRDKLIKILINSNQQCGRSNLMEIEFANSLFDYLSKYPNSYMLNFSKNLIDNNRDYIDSIVVGCEGGFSSDEISLFDDKRIVGFKTDLILQSQTAVISATSKIIV